MIQFRNRPRPRDFLDRRQQVRLLMLVSFLLGVVWMAFEARDPQHYQWIWQSGASDARDEPIDTRLRPSDSPSSDAFVVAGPDGERNPLEPISGPLTQEDLDSVRDGEPFRASERRAWFKLLDQLQETDSESLRERSIGPVTFIQLYRQPREYRGEVVSLAGTLHRTERMTAPENNVGIESYYRTWLASKDHPSDPIVVYTLSLPDGFPQGMSIDEQVELEGYFFKRWPYVARDGGRTAPVVLAKSFRWIPTVRQGEPPAVSPAGILGLAVGVAGVCVLIVWWQTRRTRSVEAPKTLFPASPDNSLSDTTHLRLVTDASEEDGRGR